MHIFYCVCFPSCSKIPCFKHIDAFMFRECPLFFLGSQLVMAAHSFPSSMRIFIPFIPEGCLSLGTTRAWQLLSSSLELCAISFWPLISYKKYTFIWLVSSPYLVAIWRGGFFFFVSFRNLSMPVLLSFSVCSLKFLQNSFVLWVYNKLGFFFSPYSLKYYYYYYFIICLLFFQDSWDTSVAFSL